MIVIEDYEIQHDKSQIVIHSYDDKSDDGNCDLDNAKFETIKQAYESLGFGYVKESLNRDYTDIEEVYLGKSENEQEFMLDQMENCMTSDDVQDVLKKALELI